MLESSTAKVSILSYIPEYLAVGVAHAHAIYWFGDIAGIPSDMDIFDGDFSIRQLFRKPGK